MHTHMTAHRLILAGALLAAAAIAVPAIAHHSSGPFYDPTKKVEVKGVVTKLNIRNPHSFLYLDVDDKGAKVEWQVEMGTGAQLAPPQQFSVRKPTSDCIASWSAE